MLNNTFAISILNTWLPKKTKKLYCFLIFLSVKLNGPDFDCKRNILYLSCGNLLAWKIYIYIYIKIIVIKFHDKFWWVGTQYILPFFSVSIFTKPVFNFFFFNWEFKLSLIENTENLKLILNKVSTFCDVTK